MTQKTKHYRPNGQNCEELKMETIIIHN